jgi:hypothetical protein
MTRTLSMLVHVRFLRAVSICGNLWRWPNRVGRTLLQPRKKALDTFPSMPTNRSVGSTPSFSLNTTIEVVMKVKHLLTIGYVGLLGPYLQHVISTFNTCSRGPTHRYLTNTGGAYNLGGVSLPNHTPRPSQLAILLFPLRDLLGLKLTNQTLPLN